MQDKDKLHPMQRYKIGSEFTRQSLGIRYVGNVGDFDVFWSSSRRRLVVKWADIYGLTCAVSDDGAETVRSLAQINTWLANRSASTRMTEEEYEVLCAIRKLFVVE